MGYSTILVDRTDGVATITLNRPQARNALDLVMRRELLTALDELEAEAGVRVVILTGAAVTVSGYYLIFPFYAAGIAGMQIAEIIHGVLAMLFVAAMLAHIYIGTLGMEGAFDAMGSGEVDLNWAKEHHSLWVEKEQGRATAAPPHPTPAE